MRLKYLKLLPTDKKLQQHMHVILEYIYDWLKISMLKYCEQCDSPIC